MESLAKNLIAVGSIILFIGVIIYIFQNKIPFIGKLPGDLTLGKKPIIIYLSLTTCFLFSLIGTVIVNIFKK